MYKQKLVKKMTCTIITLLDIEQTSAVQFISRCTCTHAN